MALMQRVIFGQRVLVNKVMSLENKKLQSVCIVTGTRAEYGLLRPLMFEIQKCSDMQLQIIATGMHLSPEFGETVTVIEEDGFTVDHRVDMLISSSRAVGVAKSVGVATISFADAYDFLKPDVVVVLGDRYEILSATQSAFLMRIPVAHLHGGETTLGALDDGIRHAISHLSSLHMPTAEPYRQKLIDMGLPPESIFKISAPGLENFMTIEPLSVSQIETAVGLNLSGGYFLLTYHPETNSDQDSVAVLNEILAAIDAFPAQKILLTKSNSDEGGYAINQRLVRYEQENPERCKLFASMGQELYLSSIRHAVAVVGNSSSGIIEAPAVDTPTVNIGDRQKGRLLAQSVIQSGIKKEDMIKAIYRALDTDFLASLGFSSPPYGRPQAVSEEISTILRRNK